MAGEEEILLIEDDEDKAVIIKSILKEQLGSTIRHIEDGEVAINFLFSEESKFVKLVLLDLVLPNVDGVEIFRRMKADERLKNIPVIILTSSKNTQEYLDALGLHPDGYANKPTRFRNCA